MFRSRKSNQKPSSELYAAFKQRFPHLVTGAGSPEPPHSTAGVERSSTTTASMDHRSDDIPFHDPQEGAMHDANPLNDAEAWRLTPSALDTNSFGFANLGDHEQSDSHSSASALNSLFHPQAGDLHTPGVPFPWGTPLSLGGTPAIPQLDAQGFARGLIQPQNIHLHPSMTHQMSQNAYTPTTFMHRDSGYESLERNPQDPPESKSIDQTEDSLPDSTSHHGSKIATMPSPTRPHALSAAQFRFHITLNAPTAMVTHSDEIPLTYLNKGQAYAISITDTLAPGLSPGILKYRSIIRIAFDDEEQRQRPAACWQLWKEGRGLAESHQRAGKLQAVEYIEPTSASDSEHKRPQVELEMASFDSFAVIWSASRVSASSSCNISLRFNFLSTDFSHSKGVKGIPVRLCAKTEILSSATPETPARPTAEVSYCKAKLFRDHGAERKLSNDIAHIKKTIEKVKQQIAHAETGAAGPKKRKRSESMVQKGDRPVKASKHQREWSVSSGGSDEPSNVEDSLHQRLASLQDMFSSTRPVSVLHLKGEEQDDPDDYPVVLPGVAPDLTSLDTIQHRESLDASGPSKSASPTHRLPKDEPLAPAIQVQPPPPSQKSEESFTRRPQSFGGEDDWYKLANLPPPDTSPRSISKVSKPGGKQGDGGWIEASGVDPLYQPPPERTIKPVACFYVLIKTKDEITGNELYKAVYLMERSAQELVRSIATKWAVASNAVFRTIRINSKGLKILVDDDVVQEMPEGQDMTVEFVPFIEPSSEITTAPISETGPLEMQLSF